jgi:hypothetical protein
MGSARCFVAEDNGRVIGAVGVAIRPILLPDGSEQSVAYVGDLKIDPASRGTLAFLRLAQAALDWARPQVSAAYGVVMDGTRASPGSYTGRVGIPAFIKLGEILVVRFTTFDETPARDFSRWVATDAVGTQCYSTLARSRFTPIGGSPAIRSGIVPQWLVHPDGLACGRLEDTRAAKRLIDSDGNEMVSAHLACAVWKTPRAGVELIEAANWFALEARLSGLFTSVHPPDLIALDAALAPRNRVIAPATLYGVGLQTGSTWNINTSEI